MNEQSAPKPILEVIACSVEDAVAAEQGGADRLELISHFELGGLTPSINMIVEVLSAVSIPVRVMLRHIEDFFVADEKMRESLLATARSFDELRIDGLVFGFLKNVNGRTEIDHRLVKDILVAAPNVRATFHRAFELLPDPLRAIAELKRHSRIDLILTSGGPDPWAEKVERYEAWEQAARPEIGILAGGGIDLEAVSILRRATSIRQYHAGTVVRRDKLLEGPVEAGRVRQLVELLENGGLQD
ncbi:MAG: copper homeostasis protein CutC [Acidobacteriota bacterium]|nr:MAG: copper homeostasis protein CutC [Acidobacteriota bacterium]